VSHGGDGMKHIRALGLAAVLAVGFAAALPVTAQQKPVDISGAWKFKTSVLPNKGCIISGDIQFRKLAKSSDYSCKFVSVEDCDRPGGPTFTKVQQSCTATLAGNDIVITSTIDKIVDAGPAEFKASMFANQAYAPDHFRVHPERGELRGFFHSSRKADVRFWREADLVG
jgi:hypothetical protein